MRWEFEGGKIKIPKLNNPILITGLPGIGNVGKVVVDFLVGDLKAKKAYDITSNRMPNTVFVNDKHLVEMPSIELHYKKFNDPKKNDLLFLVGDVQPIDEESCYQLCEQLLDAAGKLGCKEIITLGGIGLQEEPRVPKVFCTGNSKEIVDRYVKDTKATSKIYGIVGPIMGVTGLLVGIAAKKKVLAVTLLAETNMHPMYLGIKGAREILGVLEKKLKLTLNIKTLDKEIKMIEEEILKTTKELANISKDAMNRTMNKEVSYIG